MVFLPGSLGKLFHTRLCQEVSPDDWLSSFLSLEARTQLISSRTGPGLCTHCLFYQDEHIYLSPGKGWL